jgi:hypothetical protein
LDLQTAVDPSFHVGTRDSPSHLLLALQFLKAYPKDDELLGFFKINCKDTMMKWRTIYVKKLARLLANKVQQPIRVVFFIALPLWYFTAPELPFDLNSL